MKKNKKGPFYETSCILDYFLRSLLGKPKLKAITVLVLHHSLALSVLLL